MFPFIAIRPTDTVENPGLYRVIASFSFQVGRPCSVSQYVLAHKFDPVEEEHVGALEG